MKSMMKIAVAKNLAAGLASFGCLALGFAAQAQTVYRPVPGASVMKIQGDSTLHPWEMKGSMIGGSVELGAGVALDPAQAAIPGAGADGKVAIKCKAMVPVTSIKSEADHMPEVMERLMQDALKEAIIQYSLSDMKVAGVHAAGKPFQFDAKGDLTIAGTTRKVSFPVTIEAMEGDKIKVSASVPMKMTDFGVTPPAPTLAIGALRCSDNVTNVFEWVLKKKAP